MNCNDCGREITSETSTVHCSNARIGLYYRGPHICLHCAHWRMREAEFRADLRAAVEQCWREGMLYARGRVVLERAIGGE